MAALAMVPCAAAIAPSCPLAVRRPQLAVLMPATRERMFRFAPFSPSRSCPA